jgi:methionine-rich copper-binding protein CopC
MARRSHARWLAALLGLSAVWVLAVCAPAFAHAQLLEATPAAGAKVSGSPEQVRLRFNEPIDAEFDPVKVFNSSGKRVDQDDAHVSAADARVLVADLNPLPKGNYEVEWRATSVDGHVVNGKYSFTVTSGANGAQGAGRPEEPQNQGGSESGETNRIALYSGLSIGALALVALAFAGASFVRGRKP